MTVQIHLVYMHGMYYSDKRGRERELSKCIQILNYIQLYSYIAYCYIYYLHE